MLYNKYRPKSLKTFVGEVLKNEIEQSFSTKEKPHTILLHGPYGCGKTTLARIIAKKYLGIFNVDIKEINAADDTGVDKVRKIIRNASLSSLMGEGKAYIIDECHMLSNSAKNALLKILEEPPANVYFFLCTTEPSKMLKTNTSRCLEFQVQPLDEEEMSKVLKRIIKFEKLTIPKSVITLICEESLGHPRDAINLLQKIAHLDKKKMKISVKRFAEQRNSAIMLCRVFFGKKPTWKKIREVLKTIQHENPETVRRLVLEYSNSVMLREDNANAYLVVQAFASSVFEYKAELTAACYEVFLERE